jgi:hypothetical protein
MRFIASIAIPGLALVLCAMPYSAHAAGCSNASLRGTFGFQSTVTQNNDVPPLFLELAGLFRFDGLGHATESFEFARSDGAVGSASESLAYSVAPDCTFTMTQSNGGETFSGVIVADAQQFYFIETTGACCGSAIIRRGQGLKLHID